MSYKNSRERRNIYLLQMISMCLSETQIVAFWSSSAIVWTPASYCVQANLLLWQPGLIPPWISLYFWWLSHHIWCFQHVSTHMFDDFQTHPNITSWWYPLVNVYITIENGPVEIVSFPIKNGGSFQFVMWLFTRPGTSNLSHKSACLMGKSTIKWSFSIAILTSPEGIPRSTRVARQIGIRTLDTMAVGLMAVIWSSLVVSTWGPMFKVQIHLGLYIYIYVAVQVIYLYTYVYIYI